MAGAKYEIERSKDDQYFWRLKSGNGQTLIRSELYTTKAACRNGIASSRKNAPLDERYARKEAKNGDPYFTLNASNGQVLGQSETYSSVASCNNGIEATKRDGVTDNETDNS